MRANIDIPAGPQAPPRPSSLAQRRARQQQALAAEAARRRRARLLRWSGGTAVALALLAGAYLYFRAAPAPARADVADPRITLQAGRPAPDLALPTVNGETVRLADYRGTQNVLLFFQEGAICAPCWQQMRDLRAEQAKLDALNVTLLTIAIDPPAVLAEMAAREQYREALVDVLKDRYVRGELDLQAYETQLARLLDAPAGRGATGAT